MVRRILNQEIPDREIVKIALKKSSNRVSRRVHNRLFMHVEAGIDNRRHAAQPMIFP
jgi:hypothetical protein